MLRFIFSALLVVIVTLFQLTSYSFIGIIKPNFPLILILIFSLVNKQWVERLILVFVSALLLRYSTSFELQNILFIASLMAGMIIIDYLPWKPVLNIIFAIIVATIISNISNLDSYGFLMEVGYNIIFGFIAFWIFSFIYGKKIKI
jgi:hypothetical protein